MKCMVLLWWWHRGRRLPFRRGGQEADCRGFTIMEEARQRMGAMSFGVGTEIGIAAGSTRGKCGDAGGEAGDMRLPWEGSSVEQPHVASVLRLQGAPGLEPRAGSLPLV